MLLRKKAININVYLSNSIKGRTDPFKQNRNYKRMTDRDGSQKISTSLGGWLPRWTGNEGNLKWNEISLLIPGYNLNSQLKVTTFVSIGTRERSIELELVAFKNKISFSICLLKTKMLATSKSLNISKTLGTVLWNSGAQLYCPIKKQTQLHVQYLHVVVLNWSKGN